MAVNSDVINALYGALSKLLGTDITTLQKSYYDPVESALNEQKALDSEQLKNVMASRGLADSGPWLEALNELDKTYATQYENASNEATSNAYNYLLNSILAANSLGSTILGNDLSSQQLQAYMKSLSSQEDASLWGGIGSLLGTSGVGSGLVDLLSTATSGLSKTIKNLLSPTNTAQTVSTSLPTMYTKTSASNPITATSKNWATGNTYVKPSYYSGTQKASSYAGQKKY